jgi:hypothetical protein
MEKGKFIGILGGGGTSIVAHSTNNFLLKGMIDALRDKGVEEDVEWNWRVSTWPNMDYLIHCPESGRLSIHNHDDSTEKIYELPAQWDEYCAAVLAAKASGPGVPVHVGDYIVWKNSVDQRAYRIDGVGEKEGTFYVTFHGTNHPYILRDLQTTIRIATPEEVSKNEFSIGDYVPRVKGSKVFFGCQGFTKSELETVQRLLQEPVDATITIKGVNLSYDNLTNLIAML